MGWAGTYIEGLKKGQTVQCRPTGNSMRGKIESRQLCTIEPVKDHKELKKGDIVLCKVDGKEYLHLISAVSGERFQISNNTGFVNGWVTANKIYGKCISVE